ncbi:hypothetical protein IFJ75_12020 [Brevundimonas goettingensis]|uniref:DUF4139 domain-containing protein n=1 Tax=Brevundimonas goettingensis TaxID=2774190 RepID=A0A975GX46_9CAUL|nr:hypothetical protein IFJ75_12020 [Brevundimonas goettingensis]
MLGLAVANPALAQVETVSAGAEKTAVVIYRDRVVNTSRLLEESQQSWNELDRQGLALIVETRTIDLPAGETVIRLKGVATGIIPQTATLDGLPATVLERNTDFDLLSPGALLQKSVGETVRLVRTNPETGAEVQKTAIVRSGPNGAVLEIDGRLEALQCSGGPERIVFDRVPEGLSDQPILSVRTRAPTAGRYTVTLAYLATGLQWSADYVARINPDGRTLNLDGWITLANFGGTSFANAPVQVVAGNLNRDDDSVPVEPEVIRKTPGCWPMDTTTGGADVDEVIVTGSRLRGGFAMAAPMAVDNLADTSVDEVVVTGSRIVRMDTLGDYKIYTLPEPTDVRARQTKQLRLIQREGVAFERIYQGRLSAWDDEEEQVQPLTLLVRMRNQTDRGLGLPLPGGGVSLIQTQAGQSLFTGQARFEDRAVGLPVELGFGEAMDLTLANSMDRRDYSARDGHTRYVIRGVSILTNDKPEPVEVEIVPQQYSYDSFRILSSNVRSVIGDGGYPVWRVRVPARGEARLTYAYEFVD